MTRTINPAGLLDRLKHLQRTRFPNVPPSAMLLLYAQQGLLARLDATPLRDQFVLQMILMTESFQAVTVAQALTRSFAAREPHKNRCRSFCGLSSL